MLVRSTDTFVEDNRNHPQAQFTRLVEEFAQRHKKDALHGLKIAKIPTIEHHELRIKSYSSSSILETPLSVGADVSLPPFPRSDLTASVDSTRYTLLSLMVSLEMQH